MKHAHIVKDWISATFGDNTTEHEAWEIMSANNRLTMTQLSSVIVQWAKLSSDSDSESAIMEELTKSYNLFLRGKN